MLCTDIRGDHPNASFLVFLDNLFLNVDVAHCLLHLHVATMGTTRKNAAGLPEDLLEIKNTDKKSLQWNSTIARVVGQCLVFLWQHNNAVIAITTAHSLYQELDRIKRYRKRPKKTSSNYKVVFPVFGDMVRKWLSIPVPIDDYNHGMNGVDLASQLRGGYSVHRPGSLKWWKPLFCWLLDVCANNAYLLWRTSKSRKNRKLHQSFIDTLISDMLEYNKWTPAPATPMEYQVVDLPKRQRCVYGKKWLGACIQGGRRTENKRKFGTVISGECGGESAVCSSIHGMQRLQGCSL